MNPHAMKAEEVMEEFHSSVYGIDSAEGYIPALQAVFLEGGAAKCRTVVFTTLCLAQIGLALSSRSERESFFSQGFLSNRGMATAFVVTFILQIAILYIEPLNVIFRTVPLSSTEFATAAILSTIPFLAVELGKSIRRNRGRLAMKPA